ncbi:hypothetical protein [Candidatus Uabimicrobium sp. HlEnr_7]|uniref:hypothetical protein n=1 Tax=Candidatus Uabimicrobium helgolandensis TaxID=3095367 RepID=UPI003556D258
MPKKKKKKFLTKKKLAAGAVIAGLIYLAPQGGDFLKFLPVINQTGETGTTGDKPEKTKNTPEKVDPKDKETNKEPEKNVQVEEVTLRMRFIDGTLYVGNWPCPDKKTLEKTIEKLLTKYANKEVRIKYYKDGKDPYKASYSAKKLLEKAGFQITTHGGNSE